MRSKRIQVTVKQTHIDNGSPNDGENCPIALALYDRGFRNVAVGDSDDTVDAGGRCFKHTPSSRRFVERFDDGKRVRPATFRFTEVR